MKQGSGYNNHIFTILYEKFCSDKEIMMEAIKSDWEAQIMPNQLQNDEDIKKIYDDHKYISE